MAAMVSRPMVPLSAGSSQAVAGAQPSGIAPTSNFQLAVMRTSLMLHFFDNAARFGCAPRRPLPALSRLAGRIGALVGVDDLAAGGEPNALVLLHLGKRALQVFDAQGLARDHRVE